MLSETLIQFASDHASLLGGGAGALLVSLTHGKLGSRSLIAKSLSLVLPGFLNGPLFRALAVDVAKAVLAAWDPPPAPRMTTNWPSPSPPPPGEITVAAGAKPTDPRVADAAAKDVELAAKASR